MSTEIVRTTASEVDQLILALSSHWKASKPQGHTAGKASSYLKMVKESIIKNNTEGEPLGPKSAGLVACVRRALSSDEWDGLEKHMRGWF